MSTTVLVTGGVGYLGGRIVNKLMEYPEYSIRVGARNPEKLTEALTQVEYVPFDLLAEGSLDRACRDIRFIVHLGALNEIDSAQDPEKALLVNGLGTLKLLRAAERAGVERFIYMSTAHVYGAPLEGVITESNIPRPVHPYAITHRTAEDFVLSAHDKSIITGIVLRLSNGFGAPAQANVNRWTLLVNDLCRQAVTTKCLRLSSSGLQKRDFITLTDVSRVVLHFLNLPVAQCDNGLFNAGGELSLRIIDLAESIAERCWVTLGFRPPILRPKSGEHIIAAELTYSIEKLKKTGFVLAGNMEAEIDNTLIFCQRAFGG